MFHLQPHERQKYTAGDAQAVRVAHLFLPAELIDVVRLQLRNVKQNITKKRLV